MRPRGDAHRPAPRGACGALDGSDDLVPLWHVRDVLVLLVLVLRPQQQEAEQGESAAVSADGAPQA